VVFLFGELQKSCLFAILFKRLIYLSLIIFSKSLSLNSQLNSFSLLILLFMGNHIQLFYQNVFTLDSLF